MKAELSANLGWQANAWRLCAVVMAVTGGVFIYKSLEAPGTAVYVLGLTGAFLVLLSLPTIVLRTFVELGSNPTVLTVRYCLLHRRLQFHKRICTPLYPAELYLSDQYFSKLGRIYKLALFCDGRNAPTMEVLGLYTEQETASTALEQWQAALDDAQRQSDSL